MAPTPLPLPVFTSAPDLVPLNREQSAALADALPVEPWYTIPYSGLHRGLDRAFVRGPPSAPTAVVSEHLGSPGEPEFWGPDAEAGWSILSRLPGWFCLNGPATDLAPFRQIFAREVPSPFRDLGDLFYTLESAVILHAHPGVRMLTVTDAPLVQGYPAYVWGNSYRTYEELLTDGAVAGAIVDERLVAVAVLNASSPKYADIGVHTLEPFRGRGLSAAAASLVAAEVKARGLVPVWSTGSHNLASQRVAEKVGFRPVEGGLYLVSDQLKERGGYRPGQGRNTHAAMQTP